jgi:hypothetical protein
MLENIAMAGRTGMAGNRMNAVVLNSQPAGVPTEAYAVAYADMMLSKVVDLAQMAEVTGNEGARSVAVSMLDEWDELCPRWPHIKIPKHWGWPPPPPPPDWLGEEMNPEAHFLAAARVLAASEVVADADIAARMAEIGAKQFEASLERMG